MRQIRFQRRSSHKTPHRTHRTLRRVIGCGRNVRACSVAGRVSFVDRCCAFGRQIPVLEDDFTSFMKAMRPSGGESWTRKQDLVLSLDVGAERFRARHACKLFSGRRGRGGAEAFAARHESGAEGQKCGAHRSECGQTFGASASGHVGTKLDPLLQEEEANTRSAIGRLVDGPAPRSLARSSQRGFAMQSLQRVPCRQTVQFLEQNAMSSRRHLPFQTQEKTAQQHLHRHLVCSKSRVFLHFPLV